MATQSHPGQGVAIASVLLALCCILQLPPSTFAQAPDIPTSSDYLLQSWQRDDGLPQNTVSAIAQTRDKYLWVGTHGGLARFDGARFTTYRASKTEGLASDHVDCLAADRGDGGLWIGIERGGLARWQDGVFRTVAPPSNRYDRLVSLTVSGPQTVWGGFSNGRLIRWKEGQSRMFGPDDGLAAEGRVICRTDTEGRTWYASLESFGYFDGDELFPLVTNHREFFNLATRQDGGVWVRRLTQMQRFSADLQSDMMVDLAPPSLNYLQVLLEDRQGALWLGTRGNGLYRYHDGTLERIPTSHAFILSLCEDHEGNLWVGTLGGGLNRIRQRVAHVYNTKSGLPQSLVTSMCEDAEGRLFVATRNAHLASMSPGRDQVESHSAGWTNYEEFANILCSDRSAGVWLAAGRGGLFLWRDGTYHPAGFEGILITSLFQDSKTNLWVGTLQRGLWLVRNGHPAERVRAGEDLREVTAITEDPEGTLWVGTQNGTVHSRRSGELVFTRYDVAEGTPALRIQVLYADGPGAVWIGTRGAGLFRLKEGALHPITTAQGLPDDDIRQILADAVGNLWIGSASGLFRVDTSELETVVNRPDLVLECLLFGASHGLGNFEFQEGFRNAMCRTRDGRLWFSTTRGAVEVDPVGTTPPRDRPPVHIESVAVDGQAVSFREENRVILPAASRRLDIRFTATSFSAPENVRFRYRLNPLDTEWIEAGSERSVTYLRVPPGDYRFWVIARGGSGKWNRAGASLGIVARPTLWQKGWFRAAALGGLLVLVAVAVRFMVHRRMHRQMQELEQVQVLENERRRIARDMHDDLGASLTRLALMSEQVQRSAGLDAKSSTRMARISKTAKEVASKLDQIVWTVNPRNDTLERLIGYLSQYTLDYLGPSGIEFTQDLPEATAGYKIDSHVRHEVFLAFKEALNNAVKHSGAKRIALQIHLEGRQLHITLSDDGEGFSRDDSEGKGEGLANLEHRLQGVGGTCQVESTPGTGTGVKLMLPLERG